MTNILPPHMWPDGSTPDDALYSLECDPAAELVFDHDTRELGAVPTNGGLAYPAERPDFERKTGTYVEIAAEAIRVNRAQQQSGFVAWIFSPAPIQKLAA